MNKLMLTISYLGGAYCGWQVQPNAVSVQSKIQDAVEAIFGIRYDVTGCSRTDSGVHARNFVCSVTPDHRANRIPVNRIARAMNTVLPDDIAVISVKDVPDDFHPRYSATGKEYEYIFCDGSVRDVFMLGRCAFVAGRLDETAMNRAAEHFVGTHDFAAFMASGSKIKDTVRTISNCRVVRTGDTVHLYIAADGFLYNMVRIIAGTLCDVGCGKLNADDIPSIIESKQRSNAGRTLVPEGLYLTRVFYPASKEISDNEEE